jgi:hypothetical protein
MKKLLVLMLVLCVAVAANATMSLKVAPGVAGQPPEQGAYVEPVDSEINLLPSQTLWIGIYNPIQGIPGATQQGEFFLGMVVPGPGLGEWNLTPEGQHVYVPPAIPGAYNEYLGVLDWNGDGTLYLDTWDAVLTELSVNVNGIGVLDAKLFHCLGEGDVEILLFDGDGIQLDSIIIHQVPEPVTIALLGLGGLLLRRRIA